jgi:hypothetical protein
VVPATREDILAGELALEPGVVMSVVGFDLAFSETDSVRIREDLAIPVARLPVVALLKIVAWFDRPHERGKDLADLVFMFDNALPADHDARWDSAHPVAAANLEYDDQSAFYLGWELGRIAHPAHLHWAKRLVDVMRDEDGMPFAQLVREARYAGDDVELRLRKRLEAFERGLEVGAQREQIVETEKGPVAAPAPATLFGWGLSASLEKLLHDAIDRRQSVRFVYRGHERVAEPHVLGTKDGYLQILTWQTGGTSSSGLLPAWRRFFVHELSSLAITDVKFAGRRLTAGRHSSFDRHIAVVRD